MQVIDRIALILTIVGGLNWGSIGPVSYTHLGKTCACFEPALDYVVVKFPKWPFDKFVGASRRLGTQMKACLLYTSRCV